MFHALYTAATGMTAQEINLDNIANNLANSSTTGFQARRVQFTDLLYQNEIMPGAAATQQTTVAAGFADWSRHPARQHGNYTDAGATRLVRVIPWILKFRALASSRFFCPTTRLDIRAPAPFSPMRRETSSRQMGTRCSQE